MPKISIVSHMCHSKNHWQGPTIHLITIFFAAITTVALIISYMAFEKALAPVSSEDKAVVFTVRRGTTLYDVIHDLKEKGLIRSPFAFRLLSYLEGADHGIRAGQYSLAPSMGSRKILHILLEGKSIKYVITIPEGYNIYQIAELLKRAGIVGKNAFLNAAKDKGILAQYNIPGDTAEGYLFPDTYFIQAQTPPKMLITLFVRRFWSVWNNQGLGTRAEKMDLKPHKVVTLASIVEKEALLPEERPIIASVFWNRLKKGMRLQADPTVRYGLLVERNIYPRRLRTWHLRHNTPYNTYVLKGLPKGPISNPGLESLKAVLWPAQSNYLYFVSKNNGSHKFSKTLEEHNQAVFRYQIKKNRKPSKNFPLSPTIKKQQKSQKKPE